MNLTKDGMDKIVKKVGAKILGVWCIVFFPLFLCSCSAMFSSAAEQFAENLSGAVTNTDDPATVRDGLPSYLLLMDALIESDPENSNLSRSAAMLNMGYGQVFVEDESRAMGFSQKAFDLASRAACREIHALCDARKMEFDLFKEAVNRVGGEKLPFLYTLGATWAGWIQTHSKDWNAVADISRVEAVMNRVIELDPSFEDGGAYLYLGALSTLIPPALGGNPEQGKAYFEKAIEISAGKNLMAKVEYARRYARLIFDKELHDRLLKQVLEAEAEAPGHTLSNVLAKKEARKLLESSDSYF